MRQQASPHDYRLSNVVALEGSYSCAASISSGCADNLQMIKKSSISEKLAELACQIVMEQSSCLHLQDPEHPYWSQMLEGTSV